jgi:hypothetical protein
MEIRSSDLKMSLGYTSANVYMMGQTELVFGWAASRKQNV